ncbi:MAG: type II toxin-antitoxin system RelE/ParE family toxin [Deltaproteobacteria bacterium]|nr:type II toxin-antitoxin system RelE/ParE family toxin [Deltaproteobacteria bacterium]
MPYRVEWSPQAWREFQVLDGVIQRRLAAAVDGLAQNPRPPGAKRMHGRASDVWRIRVGDYRLLYQIRGDVLVVFVVKVGHRREVYRRR